MIEWVTKITISDGAALFPTIMDKQEKLLK